MLITCPSCSSAFRIDIDKVGPEGRSVRCGTCREPWFVSPAEVMAAQAEELGAVTAAAAAPVTDPELDAWLNPPPEPEATDGAVLDNVPPPPRPAKPTARAKGRGGRPAKKAKPSVRTGLAGLSPATAAGLAVLAALPLACLARVTVVRALPQTAGLYARIGLPVNLRGLELRDVVASRNPAESGRPAELVIEGDLVGVGHGDSPVPAMEVELRDAAGHAVKTYPVPAPRPVLGEAETARFRARFPDPPAGGRSVEVRFADAGAPAKADTAHALADKAEAADPHAAPDHAPAPKAAAGHEPASGHGH